MGSPNDKENQAPDAPCSLDSRLKSLMEQLPRPTVRYPDAQGQCTQILHIGESAHSIFLLEKATEQRLRLVIALKEAPQSAAKWLELLRCPLGGNPGLYNKLRLLRRALTCIDFETSRETAEYTEICIMLAKLSDTEKGVRQNFQEMKKRRIGERQPLRYEEEAAFEYKAGKKDRAEEVLERGVDNDALTPIQKAKLLEQVIAGRSGWVAAFSGSLQEQKVHALRTTMQTLGTKQGRCMTSRMQHHGKGVAATLHGSCTMTSLQPLDIPADTSLVSYKGGQAALASSSMDMLTTQSNATPVTHDRNEEGISTVCKIPHSENKSLLLTTPLIPTRSSLKSRSTSSKPPARYMFGGPPLRVIMTDRDDEDDNDDDEDDAMMESQTTPTMCHKPTAPIESAKATSASHGINFESMAKRKIDVGDISHILKWNPDKDKERKGTCIESNGTAVSLGKLAQPTPADAPLQTAIDKIPSDTSVKVLSLSRAEVKSRLQSKEVQPVSVNVSVSDKKFSVTEHIQSSRMQHASDSRVDAALSSHEMVNGSTTHAHDHWHSPKRRQLVRSIAVTKKYADLDSPISVSSSSSPPVALISNALSRDALKSLTSRVVVSGLTYIKLEQIGSGGSSKVYRMLGPDLKTYALKKIKLKNLDEQSIAQYTNEIKLLKALRGNPHIIKLIAAEQDLQHRQINVIMEHGEIDLSARLRDLNGGMDENLLRVIWTQMLQAVDAIHRMRIIHGDLKPANFLFVNGALKLIDFGIAKAIPSNDTTNIERDSQIGTVNYMSPEAIQGNTLPNGKRDLEGKMKVGRASDIWSLGCILYQIVYSKPPFADVHSIINKFRCIIDPAVPIPFPPLHNQDLEDVIRSCLQRDHRCRPQITGERGLLRHPFLRSGDVSSMTTVTMSNARQVLSQLSDLLRLQGLQSDRVNMFMSIGQEGLRNANNDVSGTPHVYDTQERRTDI